jgi:hypothetical protein
MPGERISRTSLAPVTPGMVRLASDLRRLKLEPEALMGPSPSEAQLAALSKLAMLASVVEGSAEPVVMVDTDSKTIRYANAAASSRIGSDGQRAILHPMLKGWEELAGEFRRGRRDSASSESVYGMTTYERKASFDPDSRVLTFVFSEAKRGKDTQGAACPFAVVDYSLSLDFVTFRNEAARKQFPGLARGHPLIAGLKEKSAPLRSGQERSVQDDVEIDRRLYRRAAAYSAQGDMLRIWAVETTGVASACRVKLLGFAAESAAGAPDLRKLERGAADILAAIRKEKVGLGRLELDLNRLVVMLRGLEPSSMKPDELESLRSVLAHFVETLEQG